MSLEKKVCKQCGMMHLHHAGDERCVRCSSRRSEAEQDANPSFDYGDSLEEMIAKLQPGKLARREWAQLQTDLAMRDGQLEACGQLMSIDRKEIASLKKELADLKGAQIELGAWGLPANSSQSLNLGFSCEEITRHMKENPEELARAIQKVVVVPAMPLSRKT